jgi:hypothetical protein
VSHGSSAGNRQARGLRAYRHCLATFAAGLVGLSFSHTSEAQTYLCPPPPEGVYGLPGGPKFAEVPLPADGFADKLDDPRWNGAWRNDFAVSSSTEAGVRMLREGNYLFISLEAKVDPNGAVAGADAVYLGFSRDGTTADLVKIMMTAGPPLSNSMSISSVNWWQTTDGGATDWPSGGEPLPWASGSNIHAWSNTVAAGGRWAINAKIDLVAVGAHLDSGAALANDFRFFYLIDIRTATDTIPSCLLAIA